MICFKWRKICVATHPVCQVPKMKFFLGLLKLVERQRRKETDKAPNVTPGTECNPERTTNLIYHIPKDHPLSLAVFLGFVPHLNLRLVLKLSVVCWLFNPVPLQQEQHSRVNASQSRGQSHNFLPAAFQVIPYGNHQRRIHGLRARFSSTTKFSSLAMN